MKIRRLFFRRFRGDSRGQAFVEMAIILPVFLLMVLGMIDLARAWNAKQVITDAAREAARRGVVDYQPSSGITVDEAFVVGVAAAAIANAGFDPNLATITAPQAGFPQNTPLQVDISYPYSFQFMSIFYDVLGGGGPMLLQSRAVMRIE